MNATSGKWHCVVWHVGYPRIVSPIQHDDAFRREKKERKNNFILFIGWMTRALESVETGLVRIRAFTLRCCWFGAASNYKCLCVRACIIYMCERSYAYIILLCLCVSPAYAFCVRAYTSDCAYVCVCTCWTSITSPWTSHTLTQKQPAYGRHRKTYFPLKTYNAGVR